MPARGPQLFRAERVRGWGEPLAPWRLAAIGAAIVVGLAFGWVRLFHVGPPSVEELRAAAGVDEWRVLPIGVKNDQPGLAEYDELDGTWSGFDIRIAYMIAEDLGFRRADVRFYGIESEDRARMEATDTYGNPVPVKLVVASYSITPERERMPNVMFSESYLHTEQSVLTLKDHPKVASLEEFKGKRICTLSSSTSADQVSRGQGTVIRRNKVSDCVTMLDAGQVDAVSTDAAILGGFKARFPQRYDHWDLGLDQVEEWGVNVGSNEALRELVNLTFYRSYADPQDSRWEEAYEATIAPEAQVNTETHSSKKIPLAKTQQPVTHRPQVRELPWEDLTP